MIGQVAEKGAHVVTIFDNCHSSGITRSGLEGRNGYFKARQLEYRAIPARAITDWVFGLDERAQVDMEKLQTDAMSLSSELPQGAHIQLSACRAWEEAWEDMEKEQGVFTHALIDILRIQKGEISYYELQGRLTNRMRSRDIEKSG